MGAMLLVLVILNAFCTGWLLAQVRGIRRTVSTVACVQADAAGGYPVIRRGRVEPDSAGE